MNSEGQKLDSVVGQTWILLASSDPSSLTLSATWGDLDSECGGGTHSVDGGPVLASGRCSTHLPLWLSLLMLLTPLSASAQLWLMGIR